MNVNNLLEGASPYQVLSEQSAKLAGKWEKSGLLEGIESSTEANNMAMLLENQAKQLVNEASANGTTGISVTAGQGEAWAGVALPLVRRVFGEIVAKDLVSVQPMNLPSGLIFYLDFQYGQSVNNKTANESLYGAQGRGIDTIKLTNISESKGLYGAGEFGYSLNSESVAFDCETDNSGATPSGSVSFTGILNNDTEFSASYAGQFGSTTGVRLLKVSASTFTNPDDDTLRGWEVEGAGGTFFPQFSRKNGDFYEFVISGSSADFKTAGTTTISYFKKTDFNARNDFEDTVGNTGTSDLKIPEINVQMVSDTVSAKTRKLKAQWTPEFAQDLNAYHSIDAEAELTSILSEYISMEIDLEILDMLIRNADTVEGWSAAVAKDVSVSDNNTQGGTVHATFTNNQNNLGVYYTKMSWFQTLGIKLQKVSNLIHQKTLRGGANFMVVSPKVSTILESIPGYAADSSGDDNKYAMGVQKIGAINSRYTVYKNPYMTENVILMGYKGSQFLETGAVFAPYIPLIMTPLVYDPVSFTPRKGIMTRYAKKMVRPDFYGKVLISDLNEL